MEIQNDDLIQIVDDIWTSMLGIETEFAGEGGELKSDERTISASVQITGAWDGALVVVCSHALARCFAGAMLELELDEVEDAEVNDAMGELANIAGGNLKALVDGQAKLSLPVVAGGVDLSLRVPGGTVLNNVAFRSSGDTFSILVISKDQ